MNSAEKIAHKKNIYRLCMAMLEDRINVCKHAIANAQEASNEEGKSSAGDKFETSRAMNHLEKEMYGKQLMSNLREQAALQSIDPLTLHDAVSTGSLIVCNHFDIYIAAGLGKTMVNNRQLYLLSPEAPLASLLRNKKQGDVFIFNKVEERIAELY